MAQTGLHGIVGMGLTRAMGCRRTLAGAAGFGFVLGSMLPDIDIIAAVAVYPFNAHLALSAIHRTCTHSVLVAAVITAIWALVARSDRGRLFAYGLGLGMLAHIGVDVLVWFSGVDLLWPLGARGLPSSVNLWS